MPNRNTYAVGVIFRESAQYLQINLKLIAKALAAPLLISILILIAYSQLFISDTGEKIFQLSFRIRYRK
jgi:hypothetical protein